MLLILAIQTIVLFNGRKIREEERGRKSNPSNYICTDIKMKVSAVGEARDRIRNGCDASKLVNRS